MPDRPSPPAARATARRTSLTIDVALLTPHGRRLTILLTRASDPKAKERWELPWDSVHAEETLEETAARRLVCEGRSVQVIYDYARGASYPVPDALRAQIGDFEGDPTLSARP